MGGDVVGGFFLGGGGGSLEWRNLSTKKKKKKKNLQFYIEAANMDLKVSRVGAVTTSSGRWFQSGIVRGKKVI